LFTEEDLMRTQIDSSLLEMALVGLNVKRDEIIQRMAELQRHLGVRSRGAEAPTVMQGLAAAKKVRRTMSAAARKRIADAQKLRWAKFHDAQKQATAKKSAGKKPAPKKKLSPAAKAKLVANLAKARAAKAAKKTEAEAVES
jgi:hypothetical protein